MSHLKTFNPSDWDFERHIVEPVRISSRGLTGHDRDVFLKIASEKFLPVFEKVKFAEDEYPVHLIAMGASDFYGCNRNGDGFKAAMLRKYHDTFVKHAKFFRNHKNKPERGDPWYGTVKASVYNDEMNRVELLCALNSTKEAARRNGGLVADKEIEKLASGGDLGVSMAIKVPYDVCSYCGNEAKTPQDYCTEEKCAAGGCKKNLGRLVKVAGDMHLLHVDNPKGTFFDISNVYRPADRIAYGASADYLTKSASANFSGVLSAPLSVLQEEGSFWTEEKESMLKLGYAFAILEGQIPGEFKKIQPPNFPIEKLAEFGTDKAQKQLAAMAEVGIILNCRDFCKWAGLTEVQSVSGMYRKLADSDKLAALVETEDDPIALNASSLEYQEILPFRLTHSYEKNACVGRAGNPGTNRSAPRGEVVEKFAVYQLRATHRALKTQQDLGWLTRCVLAAS